MNNRLMNNRLWKHVLSIGLLCSAAFTQATSSTLVPSLQIQAETYLNWESYPAQMRMQIRDYALEIEIAQTPAERSQGLMNRTSLAENQGMLFVMPPLSKPCFWMRNTTIPLTLAYLDADLHIVQIESLTPLSERLHCADQPIHFALEVNQGWLSSRDIKEGEKFILLHRE